MAIKHYHKNRDIILQLPEDFKQPNVWPLMSRDMTDERAQATSKEVERFHTPKKTHGNLLLKLRTLETSDTTLENDLTYEVYLPHTITRRDSQQLLRSIIKPLKELDTPATSLISHLTLPRVKVLPVDEKMIILHWIKNIKPELFSEWKREIEEDLQEYQWIKKVKKTIEEKERHGVDLIFHQMMNQMMMRMEHMAAEQQKIQKNLKLIWDKLNETWGLIKNDGERSQRAESLADFAGAAEESLASGYNLFSRHF
ncbi:hypothetical protein GGI43DRAFT_381547 [Trichoderma evansii]